MKLYLSSNKIPTPDDLLAIMGKPADEVKVAIIPNANDYYAKRAWAVKTQRTIDLFKSLGFKTISIVDLRDYDSGKALKEELADADLVWVRGGNTFCLRYEMQRSGFEDIIHDLLRNGVVYGGESAGAIVAGSDLNDVELMDEPEFAEAVVRDGLHLIESFILPHADNVEYEEAVAEIRQRRLENSIVLKDAEALIINGDETSIVSAE